MRRIELTSHKRILCQPRHEFDGSQALDTCQLIGGRSGDGHAPAPDSQDAWIWHNRWTLPQALALAFEVPLGVPGCDNKIIHLLSMAGFVCHSEPRLVRAYHYHRTQLRGYARVKPVPPPYIALLPSLHEGETAGTAQSPSGTFDFVRENDVLREFIAGRVERGRRILLPRLGGIENDIAALGAELAQTGWFAPR